MSRADRPQVRNSLLNGTVAQWQEANDLESLQDGFESHAYHQFINIGYLHEKQN